jgi:hypothetical protein
MRWLKPIAVIPGMIQNWPTSYNSTDIKYQIEILNLGLEEFNSVKKV